MNETSSEVIMRCVHPTCNSKSDTLPKDIAFHSIPSKPSIRAIWLKLLNTEPSELGDDGAVCSKHFLKADLYYDKVGTYRIRAGALPIVNLQKKIPDSSIVKICRICFATERKLYNMTNYNNLDGAYNIITGLSLENEHNLPQYLCSECAQRLLNCVHFRTRSLRAHLILLEAIKKHKSVTLQSVKAVIGGEGQLGSHLKVKEISDFDLVINDDEEVFPQEDTDGTDNADVKMEKNNDDRERKPSDHKDLPDLDDIKADSDGSVSQDNNEDAIRYSPTDVFKDLEEEDEDSVDETIENMDVDETCNKHTVVKSDSDEEPLILVKVPDIDKINKLKQVPVKSQTKKYLETYRILADKLIIKPGSARAKRGRGETAPVKVVKLRRRPNQEPVTLEKTIYQTVNDVPSSGSLRGNSKPYSCRYCDFETILKRDLNVHTKVCDVRLKIENTGSKPDHMPHRCKVCKEQFKYSYELQVHMPVHTGKKPYKCNVCKKTFNFETSLNLHARRLHPEKVIKKLLYDRQIKGKPVSIAKKESK